MTQCKCGSYAINHHLHGRDGSEPELCDVCYWREKYEVMKQRNNELLSRRNYTGIAIDKAMRGILPDEHPLLSRLKMIANVSVQHNELIEALDGMLSVSPIPTANDEYEAAFYAAINALVKATGCTK